MYNKSLDQNYLNDRDLMMIRLTDIDKKFSDLDWRVFEIIVSRGISEEKEAKEAAINTLIHEDRLCISKDTAWLH